MEKIDITLLKIRNRQNLDNSIFFALYKRLVLGDVTLLENEKFHLLKVAVFFLILKMKMLKSSDIE